MAFFLLKQPPDDQTINFDIKCHINSESYDRHSFCGTEFRGGPDLFTVGGFFKEREYSEVEYPDLLISDFQMPLIYGDNR